MKISKNHSKTAKNSKNDRFSRAQKMQQNDKYDKLRADRAYMATSILIGGFLGQYHFENRSKNKTEILEISYF